MSKISVAEQYLALKEKHKDELVFFQIGEFYELLFEDAINASNLLNINLTKRGKFRDKDIPLCGVPGHALDLYINKLLKQKYKVAVYQQSDIEGDTNRFLNRIYTSGTLLADELLQGNKNNFLLCIYLNSEKKLECAIADLSTGELYFKYTTYDDLDSLLLQWNPAEILISAPLSKEVKMDEVLSVWQSYITIMEEEFFKVSDSIFADFFGQSYEAQIRAEFLHSTALKGLLHYVQYTNSVQNKQFKTPQELLDAEFMYISKNSRINLELCQTMTGEKEGSLLIALNRTATAIGSRWLIRQLNAPLKDKKAIETRLDHVEFFLQNYELSQKSSDILSELPDMERAAHRIMCQVSKKNDFLHIRKALNMLMELHKILQPNVLRNVLLQNLDQVFQALSDLNRLFTQYIVAEGLNLNTFVNTDANEKMQKFTEMEKQIENMLFVLENEYKSELEIKTLKIKYQQGLGYFIEVPLKEANKMTYSFKLLQNLANARRYMTGSLEDLNLKYQQLCLNKQELEKEILNELLASVKAHKLELYKLYELLGQMDTFIAFAKAAKLYGLSRPKFVSENCLLVKQGYHLSIASNKKFKANDIEMKTDKSAIVLTGPNMSGKSTYMRQNAQLIVLAQIGSFVPAKEATLSLIDAIFTRIGAYDDITQGKSTFMCEMSELSQILQHATENSFILLDEIGRGTTPKEGQAIAQAVLEHIIDNIKAKTIFATHFCDIPGNLMKKTKDVQCKMMSSKHIADHEIEFLYQLMDGISEYSYGIAVAKQAGLASGLIKRAMEIYNLE